MRSPGLGMVMPIASYSGSYQPAPRPTSSRPPLKRSMVARLLASTDAGRNASQSTSVPSRAVVVTRARAPRATIGSYTPWRSSDPPYFATSRNRWSDSQSESYPARSAVLA